MDLHNRAFAGIRGGIPTKSRLRDLLSRFIDSPLNSVRGSKALISSPLCEGSAWPSQAVQSWLGRGDGPFDSLSFLGGKGLARVRQRS